MRTLELELAGRVQKVLVEKVAGVLWIKSDQGIFSYTPPMRSYDSAGAGAGDGLSILAPMPGKVKKVFLQAGDEAQEGQTVVVVEAMKMEFELKAPRRLRVTKIQCEEGAQVRAGQLLVEFKGEDQS